MLLLECLWKKQGQHRNRTETLILHWRSIAIASAGLDILKFATASQLFNHNILQKKKSINMNVH